MKRTFKILFFLEKNRNQKERHLPYCCTYNNRWNEKSVQYQTRSQVFSVECGIGKSLEAQQINMLIKTKAHQIYHELVKKDSRVTAEKVKNDFLGIGKMLVNFWGLLALNR